MCIYWKATLYTFTAVTLSAVILEQKHTQKEIICTSYTRVCIRRKKSMYIHSRQTHFKIFKHLPKTIWFRCTRDTCVKSEGYTILTNRGETISNTHYTATACPLSESLLSQASDSQVFQWSLNDIFLLHYHHLQSVQLWKKKILNRP
jgi:hypothetical protein